MTTAFVKALEETARVLARFAEPAPAGARRWDGTAYVAASASTFEPYAAKWSSALTALAGILEGHDAPLSERQKQFLDRFLFGGMGSLNDFALDEGRLGADANQANQELDRLRSELFAQFQGL